MTWFLTSLSIAVLSFMQVESIDSNFRMYTLQTPHSMPEILPSEGQYTWFLDEEGGVSFSSGHADLPCILILLCTYILA